MGHTYLLGGGGGGITKTQPQINVSLVAQEDVMPHEWFMHVSHDERGHDTHTNNNCVSCSTIVCYERVRVFSMTRAN